MSHISSKLTILFLLIVGFFAFSSSVSAYEQTDFSVQSPYMTNTNMIYNQRLGNGLTGAIATTSLRLNVATSSHPNNYLAISVYEYSNSGYTTLTNAWNATTTLSYGVARWYSGFMSGTFNPARYYTLTASAAGAGSPNVSGTTFGSSNASSYPNGIATTTHASFPTNSANFTGIADLAFYTGSNPPNECYAGQTCIISITPSGQTATSSSFTVRADIYVDPDDYDDDLFLTIQYLSTYNILANYYAATPGVSTDLQSFSFEFPVTGSGFTSYSTTTDFSGYGEFEGDWTIAAQLSYDFPWWELPFQYMLGSRGDILTTYNDVWQVGTSTSWQIIRSDVEDFIAAAASTALIDEVIEACTISWDWLNPFNFSLFRCVKATVAWAITPDLTAFTLWWSSFRDNVLNRFPLGYVTRLVTIISSTGAVLPPDMSYSFGSSSPQLLQSITAGDPINFNVFEHFDVLASIKSDQGTNKNIWDIVMPYFEVAVTFAILFVILEDLFAIRLNFDGTQETTGRSGKMGDNRYVLTRKEEEAINRGINKGVRAEWRDRDKT